MRLFTGQEILDTESLSVDYAGFLGLKGLLVSPGLLFLLSIFSLGMSDATDLFSWCGSYLKKAPDAVLPSSRCPCQRYDCRHCSCRLCDCCCACRHCGCPHCGCRQCGCCSRSCRRYPCPLYHCRLSFVEGFLDTSVHFAGLFFRSHQSQIERARLPKPSSQSWIFKCQVINAVIARLTEVWLPLPAAVVSAADRYSCRLTSVEGFLDTSGHFAGLFSSSSPFALNQF